ncbi:MAG: MarC family protein [Pseudomonadota bacterium]
MFDLGELIKLTVALVAIVDIPGNIPMFLERTGAMTARERQTTAVVAGLATGLLLILFANAGEAILSTFGISIEAFRVLGGIVVLLIALSMLGLLGDDSDPQGGAAEGGPVVVGIFPLAVPLFAGPGAITAVMVYAHAPDKHSGHDMHVSLVIVSVSLLIVAGLVAASLLSRLITPVAQTVMNRLFGMIVGALGIEFMLEGIAGFFLLPSLAP